MADQHTAKTEHDNAAQTVDSAKDAAAADDTQEQVKDLQPNIEQGKKVSRNQHCQVDGTRSNRTGVGFVVIRQSSIGFDWL